jgi:hypothetical protein
MEENRIFDLVLVKYGRFLVNYGHILVKCGRFLEIFGIDVWAAGPGLAPDHWQACCPAIHPSMRSFEALAKYA